MNKFIEQELKNVKIARLPDYKSDTLKIFIPRGIREIDDVVEFKKNHYYQIKFDDIVIHPKESFLLHTQWNKNIIPKDEEMNIQVVDIMNNMIKISGTGVTSHNYWSGWIPKELMTIIDVLS